MNPARAAALDAFHTAAAAGTPPHEAFLTALDVYDAAGHPPPEMAVTPQAAAAHLADLSGHLRYAADGWRRLLTDSVEHAHAIATARYAADPTRLQEINDCRDILLAHHTTQGDTP